MSLSLAAKFDWWRSLGPGLMWAGTAIGVSHLVQSTRAGASWGLGLLWVVILANVFKYPAFEAGPRYAAATRTNLLEGYLSQGRWALWLFLALTVGTMFSVVAAVTLVTAGMATQLVSESLSPVAWSGLLLVSAVSMLSIGRFRWLEGSMKWMMLALALITLICVVGVGVQAQWSGVRWTPSVAGGQLAGFGVIVALVGWMPSAIDISVWQSLWNLQKAEQDPASLARAQFDFNVGYWATALLAIAFVVLGAGVLYGSGEVIPNRGGAFAALFVELYCQTLGAGWRPLVLGLAFVTMFSTTVAVCDGFPRALSESLRLLGVGRGTASYWFSLVVVSGGAMVLISFFAKNLLGLVDLATTLSFLSAPVLAWLNYKVVSSERVSASFRPGPKLKRFHQLGIVFMTVVAVAYLLARLGG